jgi:subtilase family serine protease
MLGARAVPTLCPGASDTGAISPHHPGRHARGHYYVIAKADGDDAIGEINEANNTYGSYLTVGADLAITSLVALTEAGAGFPLTITDTTKNFGAGTAGASTTTYYLSTNNDVLDATDLALGSRSVPALAPGASDTAR